MAGFFRQLVAGLLGRMGGSAGAAPEPTSATYTVTIGWDFFITVDGTPVRIADPDTSRGAPAIPRGVRSPSRLRSGGAPTIQRTSR